MKKNKSPLMHLWTLIFVLIFIVSHYHIFINVYLLSRDILFADFSIKNVRPQPHYNPKRLPDVFFVRQAGAYNHLALDFAQVYFPSRRFDDLKNNYMSGEYDPKGRSSRYAPFIHYLCSLTYCRLDYGQASFIHLFLQILLFYVFFVASFVYLKITNYIPFGILLVNVSLFLTPAGISWFERGQFSLYVALSYLFILLFTLERRFWFILLSALFAFVKWTSFPFIFVIMAIILLVSNDYKNFKLNILFVSLFLTVVILLLVFFSDTSYYFLRGLYEQERFSDPEGVSLIKLLPKAYVKIMPLLLIFLGLLYARKYRGNFIRCMPFFTAVGILMLMYPTIAYEYNMPAMLGFVPLMLYWSSLPENQVEVVLRRIVIGVFVLFLLSASYTKTLGVIFANKQIAFLIYLISAAFFSVIPIVLSSPVFHRQKNKNLSVDDER